jgi:hypothetical protein
MPMLVLVGNLSLIDADRLAARCTIFDVHLLEALATVGFRHFHEIALAAQKFVTVKACKVSHMPAAAFSFSAFVAKNYLIASWTARLVQLGVVTTAVDLRVACIVKVDQIDEKLITCRAVEASRVPTGLRTSSRGKYSNRAVFNNFVALKEKKLT